MKRLALPASALALVLFACGPSTPAPTTAGGASSSSTASSTDAVPTASSAAPTASTSDAAGAKPISLSPIGGSAVTVKVGAKLVYAYKSHGSVGYGAAHHLDAQTVVRFVSDDIAYDRPDAASKPMPGGDGGTGRMLFEAVAKGTATLQIDETFRGTVSNTVKFTITVE